MFGFFQRYLRGITSHRDGNPTLASKKRVIFHNRGEAWQSFAGIGYVRKVGRRLGGFPAMSRNLCTCTRRSCHGVHMMDIAWLRVPKMEPW